MPLVDDHAQKELQEDLRKTEEALGKKLSELQKGLEAAEEQAKKDEEEHAKKEEEAKKKVAEEAKAGCGHADAGDRPSGRHRFSWAKLLARVFRIDVSVCPECGGPMRVIAALSEPASIRRCLEGMGLSGRAPPIAPARPDPQPHFDSMLT